jgi:hypothetical protein
VHTYIEQIFTGNYGTEKNPDNTDKTDPNGDTFMDPVLAGSINPWSNKLGPEVLGPGGNQGTGVVLENRHLEYLDPRYGKLVDEQEAFRQAESAQYAPPKAGVDNRTENQKAMYESVGARETGPAIRPIDEWEATMMNVYQMVKALNSR